MDDDIFEFKLGLGPITLNFNALLRRLKAKSNKDKVAIVAERFLQLFLAHGIAIPQIPRLISQVTLEKLQSTELLLATLSSEVIERTSALFGVRRSWLEGVDDRIYETLTCYKQPSLFFETCSTLNMPENGFAVRAIATSNPFDASIDRWQPLALVLVERVQYLGIDEITRYHVYGDAWDWSHPPCRIQLKAIARLMLKASQRPIPIHKVKPAVLQAIIEGKCVPHAALQGCLLTNPSLEDFALSRDESVKAKEIGELPKVYEYINQHDLEKVAEIGFCGFVKFNVHTRH